MGALILDQIKTHLLGNDYQPKTVEELAVFFNVPIKTIQDVIEPLIDEGLLLMSKRNKVITPAMANLIVGTILINPKGYGFLQNDQLKEDIFIPAIYINSALNKDEVMISLHREKNEEVGQVVKVIKRFKTQMVGRVKSKNKKYYLESLDQSINQWIPLKTKKSDQIKTNHMVVAQITSYEPLVCQFLYSLGHMNDAQVDIKALLSEFDIPLVFSEAILKEANQVSLLKDKGNRTDLRSLYTFTIDNEDAKDFDDAISISKHEAGYELGVHIADVAFYVKENSLLDLEARQRGTSVYAADFVAPMLPEILSNNVCSLQPNQERYTISCMMQINNEGEITSSRLFTSTIESKQRFTYAQVNDIILKVHGEADDKHVELIQNAYECAQALRKHRNQEGNLDFVSSEPYFIMDQGKVLDIAIRSQNEAEGLIESFMIAANESVAHTLKTMDIPAIYRVHENPDPSKIRELAHFVGLLGYPFKGNPSNIHQSQLKKMLAHFADTNLEMIVNKMTLRSMKKATYESVPVGHFGLALKDYLHFTAPIRRYPDLIVHRMIHRYIIEQEISNTQIKSDQEHNTEYAKLSTLAERKAIDAERAVEDMKKAEYMMDYVGDIFEGYISGVTSFGFFVQLANTVEGLVPVHTLDDDYYSIDFPYQRLVGFHNKRKFSLGDKILVRVKHASKEKRQIDFAYIKHIKGEIIKYNN